MKKRRKRAIVQQYILRRTAERKRMKQSQEERQREYAIERGDCPNCFQPPRNDSCDCLAVLGKSRKVWWQKD